MHWRLQLPSQHQPRRHPGDNKDRKADSRDGRADNMGGRDDARPCNADLEVRDSNRVHRVQIRLIPNDGRQSFRDGAAGGRCDQ